MAHETVKVELISNPEVTRMMTIASFRNNRSKWREVGAVDVPIVAEKKRDVSPAVPVEKTPEQEPAALLNGLREQYKAKFGKDPDKRLNVKSLAQKINEVSTDEFINPTQV